MRFGLVLLACVAALSGLPAQAAAARPGVEPGILAPALASGRCEDPTFPECRRLHLSYGPLVVGPGFNAQLVGPVTIEKPAYDGYMTRIEPNLVRADGRPPRVDLLHLHHGVWLSVPQYGSFAPFFGVGEEKTIARLPSGYGFLVRGSDVWVLNYMLHNLTTRPETVWITYDVDYVPRAAAERRGIKRVVPLWLDVRNADHPFYPVFNVQQGFGHRDARTRQWECTYPRERCATLDPFRRPQGANGRGYDWTVPAKFAGTLVMIAGHLHPGGLRDEVSLVRRVGGRDRVRRIFTSKAVYYGDRSPTSWDFSMTVSKPGWRVQVRPGDRIRLNAVYDLQHASWYEGMGIVMAAVAPGERSGVDPFSKRARIETRGLVTHGHLPENDNHGGGRVRPLPTRLGNEVNDVVIANFAYGNGDLSRVASVGLPRVRENTKLTFWNADGIAGIWHTITGCKPPCSGSPGVSYPIADARPPLDSLELGWAPPDGVQPTSGRFVWSLRPRDLGLRPGDVYTFFCRVHPFMRGAFKVTY